MVVNYEIAFFTSRGIGIVDVQYGGSTGHGREYRERLDGNWGVVDVEDCAAVARGLVERGIADPARIAIRGGSAGGWTSTGSIAAEPDLYRAAAIYYPVLDAVEWRRRGTHDFESQYLDSLIGPWPDAEPAYVEQAPINRADRIQVEFVLFQGLADAVCPPAQAERLVGIAKEHGVAHRYLTFDGEGHGFRRTATVIACLEAELALYTRAFGEDR
jgi:dipeptidyl aminopeptidase/acylaminoacyl peptidase